MNDLLRINGQLVPERPKKEYPPEFGACGNPSWYQDVYKYPKVDGDVSIWIMPQPPLRKRIADRIGDIFLNIGCWFHGISREDLYL